MNSNEIMVKSDLLCIFHSRLLAYRRQRAMVIISMTISEVAERVKAVSRAINEHTLSFRELATRFKVIANSQEPVK